ncbi:MAG: hypothetical protein J6Y39_07210 [Bacteroidaceae bacterium]|nr:hypothetical protein [Bacteroidaceae bacterium]
MSKRLATIVGVLLLATILLAIVASWIFSALGYPLHNVISAEGLRWLFTRSLRDKHNILPSFILFLITVSLYIPKAKDGIKIGKVGWIPLLLLLFFLPSSPLLGVTGGLFPSPLLRGIVPVFCMCAILLALVRAVMQGRLTKPTEIITFLSGAILPHNHWVIVCLIMLFLFNLIDFIR